MEEELEAAQHPVRAQMSHQPVGAVAENMQKVFILPLQLEALKLLRLAQQDRRQVQEIIKEEMEELLL